MEKKRIRCRGFLFAELIVSMSLLGLIIAGLAVSMNGFSMVNDYQWARQRCTAAAQAQLDSLVATGHPIEPQELQRLWAGVDVVTEKAPGGAPWEGLELIQVTATAQPGSRKVTVHLARYVGPTSPLHTRSPTTGGSVKAEGLGDRVPVLTRDHRQASLDAATPGKSQAVGRGWPTRGGWF